METLHILIRVSTTTQEEDGTSLITQKRLGIELSKQLGMDYQVHNEGGTSSSKETLENRPIMVNLLKLILTSLSLLKQRKTLMRLVGLF
jgi:DNA invertase Pin-like site-specific DNA recombinase